MILLLNLVLPAQLIYLGVARIGDESWNPAYYNQLSSTPPALERGPWLEVIEHFNQHIDDDHVTMMFNSYVFAYFADRPVIDPYLKSCYEALLPLLGIGNRTLLLEVLSNSNIRYFLIPTPVVPELYSVYATFAERFLLFEVIQDDPAFTKIQEFTYYDLYILKPSS